MTQSDNHLRECRELWAVGYPQKIDGDCIITGDNRIVAQELTIKDAEAIVAVWNKINATPFPDRVEAASYRDRIYAAEKAFLESQAGGDSTYTSWQLALAAADAVGGWRPIEGVPRDGNQFLGLMRASRTMDVLYWDEHDSCYRNSSYAWYGSETLLAWQPLPDTSAILEKTGE